MVARVVREAGAGLVLLRRLDPVKRKEQTRTVAHLLRHWSRET